MILQAPDINIQTYLLTRAEEIDLVTLTFDLLTLNLFRQLLVTVVTFEPFFRFLELFLLE